MTARSSNDDFVWELMRFGNPMKQLVIMEAIKRYASDCAQQDPATLTGGVWNFIDARSWVSAAAEINTAFEKRGL